MTLVRVSFVVVYTIVQTANLSAAWRCPLVSCFICCFPIYQRVGKSSSGGATADKPDTGIAQVLETLTTEMVDMDMAQALERWAERAPEQKEAAVRYVQ